MGCGSSKPPAPKSATETRLEKAISVKRAEHDEKVKAAKTASANNGKPHAVVTLESIIMKFMKVKHALSIIKDAFNSHATDGSLNFEGLVKAMNVLHGRMTEHDIRLLFDFVDLDDSKSIEIKEFLVALTVGHCLHLVPEIIGEETYARATEGVDSAPTPVNGNVVIPVDNPSADIKPEPIVVSEETKKKAKEIAEMLDLVVTAWILFDAKGKGYVDKAAITQVMGDGGGSNVKKSQKGAGNSIGDDKMKEMDVDNGGTVDFAEFVFSFASWVDLDEELGGEDEDK